MESSEQAGAEPVGGGGAKTGAAGGEKGGHQDRLQRQKQ